MKWRTVSTINVFEIRRIKWITSMGAVNALWSTIVFQCTCFRYIPALYDASERLHCVVHSHKKCLWWRTMETVGGLLGLCPRVHYSWPWHTPAYDNGLLGIYGSMPTWITRKQGIQWFMGVKGDTMLPEISWLARGGRFRIPATRYRAPTFVLRFNSN